MGCRPIVRTIVLAGTARIIVGANQSSDIKRVYTKRRLWPVRLIQISIQGKAGENCCDTRAFASRVPIKVMISWIRHCSWFVTLDA